MVDFITALRTGLSSAEIAEQNKQEIDDVFAELNRQLTANFDGKIVIGLSAGGLVDLFAAPFSKISANKGIGAWNPKNEKDLGMKLAGWSASEIGYPCRINFSNREMICEDREALEDALKQLLASPSVGKIIHQLLNQENLAQV
jgi:hypothetical protein